MMTLKEQLVEDIRASRLQAKRKRRDSLGDDEWWSEIRELEIKPVLEAAVLAFRETSIAAKRVDLNGGSGAELTAGREGARLTLTHAAGRVTVTSSESESVKEWDRQHTTPAEIVLTVREFAALVAAKNLEPGSVYEGRGIHALGGSDDD